MEIISNPTFAIFTSAMFTITFVVALINTVILTKHQNKIESKYKDVKSIANLLAIALVNQNRGHEVLAIYHDGADNDTHFKVTPSYLHNPFDITAKRFGREGMCIEAEVVWTNDDKTLEQTDY